jgi:hypothetical protein
MNKLQFSVQINASRSKIWQTLWDDSSYRLWTAVFTEGSFAESNWKEGDKILFLNGQRNGMASKIARLITNELMSFQHLGEVKEGVEDYSETGWTGAFETYSLQENETGVLLTVELDVDHSFADYFTGVFPKALARIKELAEA